VLSILAFNCFLSLIFCHVFDDNHFLWILTVIVQKAIENAAVKTGDFAAKKPSIKFLNY